MFCQDLIPSREICNFGDTVDYAIVECAGEVFVVSVDGGDPPPCGAALPIARGRRHPGTVAGSPRGQSGELSGTPLAP